MKELDFIKAFIKNPGIIGAIMPTSKFAAGKMADLADLKDSRCVVEFGAGTGAITKKILAKMPHNSTLFCFEIDKNLIKILTRSIKDPRLKIINDGAENFYKHISENGFEGADRIISALPLSTLSKNTRNVILKSSSENLKDNGVFVQIQYSLASLSDFKKFFPSVLIDFELLNIPPAFIYVCRKTIKVKNKMEFNIIEDVELSKKLAPEE